MEAALDDGCIIEEGTAKIHFKSSQNPDVFYNPVQQFNRDLSILAISTFIAKHPPTKRHAKVNLLEALSASGLRSIRYAKEISGLQHLTINDICANAVESIRRNCAANDISIVDDQAEATNSQLIVKVSQADATMLMYQSRDPLANFFVIDIDPYGSAAPFLDAAVQAVADGGLLCVTCTDMAVLCGSYTETCFAKYGSTAVRGSAAPHESALRILLHAIDAAATKYKRTIEPLLSLSIDFYVRVFVRVKASAHAVKFAASKRSLIFACAACKTTHAQPLGRATLAEDDAGRQNWKFGNAAACLSTLQTCSACGAFSAGTETAASSAMHVGGPLWNAPLHDANFVRNMLQALDEDGRKWAFGTTARIRGMLATAAEELPDVMFYHPLAQLASVLRCPTPPLLDVYSALLHAGYRVSGSHCEAAVVKTDAPPSTVWACIVRWATTISAAHYDAGKLAATSPGRRIYDAFFTSPLSFSFELHAAANPASRQQNLVRYQPNPTKYWGPKSRPAKRPKSE